MKKFFSYWKFLSLFMLVMYACNKKDKEASVAEPNIDYVKVEKLLSGAFQQVDEYKARNSYDLRKITDVVNVYTQRETGTADAVNFEQLDALMQKYEKYRQLDNPSIQPLINALMSDKLLSGVQGALLSELDAQMVKTADINLALRLLDDFEAKVIDHQQLNNVEKTILRLFKSGLKTGFEFVKGDELSRNDCTDCLVRRKWQIFGWSCLVVVVGLVGCIIATGGFGAPACIAAIAAGWATVIKWTCPYCFKI
jgi:hypothetical protein